MVIMCKPKLKKNGVTIHQVKPTICFAYYIVVVSYKTLSKKEYLLETRVTVTGPPLSLIHI